MHRGDSPSDKTRRIPAWTNRVITSSLPLAKMTSGISCRKILICIPITLVIMTLGLCIGVYFLLFFEPTESGATFLPLVSYGGSAMDSSEECYFDVGAVSDGFTSALVEDDDVGLKEYIDSYKELSKFFVSMGKIFSFIASDVDSKLEILEDLLKTNGSENFSTMKKMVTYEMDNNLLEEKSYVSGSRTLLRLHRGLDFIRKFLQKVGEANNTDSLSKVGHEVYADTLAHHHSWLVRKGVSVAMYALPTREGLLNKLYGDNDAMIQRAIDVLPKMLSAAEEVYERTENFYTVKKLHELP